MTRPPLADLTLVAGGSALGAVSRWGLSLAEQGAALPWVTLTVNVVGAFLLAALPLLPAVRRSRRLALVLGPGVLAGFTTVSAWAGQVTGLAADGREAVAGAHLVGTLAGALVAAHLGRRWAASRAEPGTHG